MESVVVGMALHYTHTSRMQQVLGTWLRMGLVLGPGTFANNCDVLSGGDF